MKKYFLFAILCTFSIISFGQLRERQKIDSIFKAWDRPDVPGCALGVVKEGKLIYAKGYGIGDLEHDIPLTPWSVFYIGSVSKQFVTFSILLLEEQGKLDLDDRIQKYLPDFPEYGTPLTIRHFIHHTSGVRDFLTLMHLKGRNYLDNTDVNEVYDLIKRQKTLNFSPGEKYLYSNSCYFMLAMIIEKAAGQSLKEFAHENIFEPLGMKHTLFYDDNTDLIKNRVFSYHKKPDGDGFDNLIMRFDLVGSGGVYSNIGDLFLWDQNFYDNKLGKGGQGIIDKMHEEGLLNNGESSGYAFALHNGRYKGLKTVSHGGSLAGYRAQLLRFPEERFSVIILANRGDAKPTGKAYQVADIMLKDKLVDEPKKKGESAKKGGFSDTLEKFTQNQLAGIYEIQPGVVLEITVKNGSLHVLQRWDNSSYQIVPTIGNTYETLSDPSIQFEFSALENDLTQTLTVFQNGNETTGTRKAESALSILNLEDYTGEFYSDELDVSYLFVVEDAKLKVKVADYEAQELTPKETDTFVYDGKLVRFNRENGAIKGFELDAGRVTNLKFDKQ